MSNSIVRSTAEFHSDRILSRHPIKALHNGKPWILPWSSAVTTLTLQVRGFRISPCAKDVLVAHSHQDPGSYDDDLLVVSRSYLGVDEHDPWIRILQEAKERGLRFCQVEDGLRLARIVPPQPFYSWLYLGMESVPDLGGREVILKVGTTPVNQRWLGTFPIAQLGYLEDDIPIVFFASSKVYRSYS